MRILIPDSESGHAIWVCEGLKLQNNVELHIMSYRKNSALKYFKAKRSFFIIKECKTESKYVESILRHADRIKADIVLPIGEKATNIFSKNLGFIQKKIATIPIPQQTIFETSTNKIKLAEFCNFHNIPSPFTIELKTYYNKRKNIKIFEFPVIVKPDRGDGGKNIFIFNSKTEIQKFESIKKDYSMGQYLVQEFVKGYDIDMSILSKDGIILAYTIQKGFIKRKNQFAASAGIDFLYNQKLYDTVQKLINKLNFTGIAHIDLRYDEKTQEYKIVEMNVRFWGSLLGSIKAGVNFPYLACLTGLGINYSLPQYKHNKFIDIIPILKTPKIFINGFIDFKETNSSEILRNPVAHIFNVLQR